MSDYPHTLNLIKGDLALPAYLPDATFAQVRALDAQDLRNCQVKAVMMNTFHLMSRPGSSTIKSLGGLHAMSGWDGPIFADSGGFQAYSLIRQNPAAGRFSEDGLIYQPPGSARRILLTPEKCVQLQLAFGADVLFCLDDCTHVDDSEAEQRLSVHRTIAWAKRCRKEFDTLTRSGKTPPPLLFAVVQGGDIPELRRECANALLEIGFDGYGYGGWPLDGEGALVEDSLILTRELIPEKYVLHALGIGHPVNVARCARLGYGIFDSAMPTRDARHGRLYRFKENTTSISGRSWLEYVYISDEKHRRSSQPVEPGCDCPVCAQVSLGYLRHLFKLGDCLYQRLATMHNLHFMARLTERLRAEPHA